MLLVLFRNELLAAHFDERIQYFSSDAANYLNLFHAVYEILPLNDNPTLFLIGSPILFMKLADGNLFLIQISNLVLMGYTLKIALKSFVTLRGRLLFLVGTCAMPYFTFGFLSLNKEVYAMCSAIFFASYMVRGLLWHLVIGLLLAVCARYYMFIAMLMLAVLVPRNSPPRFSWVILLLFLISFAAPVAKYMVPEYSDEGLLEVSGVTGIIFSKIINAGGYAFVYPIKYLALIPQRAYSFLIDSSREGDAMEAVVSIVSIAVILISAYVLKFKKIISGQARALMVAGFIAPIPIMWSEIMHWRYFSFVYFFFLYALVLHYMESPSSRNEVKFSSHA